MMGLTPRERDVLDFLRGYLAEHGGVGPNFDEITSSLGLQSKSSASRLLANLETKQVIRRIPRRARAIEIIAQPETMLEFLPPALRERVTAHCARFGDTPEDVVVDAVGLHLDACAKKAVRQ